MLFNIYFNDLASSSSHCEVYQYANDTLLLSRHQNNRRTVEMLPEDTVNMNWCNSDLIYIST